VKKNVIFYESVVDEKNFDFLLQFIKIKPCIDRNIFRNCTRELHMNSIDC